MDSKLDPFDDILLDSTSTCVAKPGGKFQPRAKLQPSKVTAAPVTSALPPNATEKTITPSVSSLDIDKPVQSAQTAEDGVTGTVCSVPASSAGIAEPSKSNNDKAPVLSAGGVDSYVVSLDQLDDIFCSSATDHVVPATKFQPRVKKLPREVTTAAVDPPTLPSNAAREADIPSPTGLDATNIVQPIVSEDVTNTGPVGSLLASSVGDRVPIERNNGLADEAGSSAFYLDPSDELNPNTASNLHHNIPPTPTSLEFPVEKEQTAEKKTSPSREKRPASGSKLPTKSVAIEMDIEMDEGGQSSRQLRKQATTTQLVDEQENGAPAEPASSSGADENDEDYAVTFDENRDDGNNTVESASKKKRASQKSKKPVAEKEKPVRKRKKANDTDEQSTKKPPKKFSHSTRRNKRYVNKELLNMPEDEIDYSSLAIKDIIFLAEHKEKLEVKESKASVASSKTSLGNHSSERYSSGMYSQDEEVPFNSEQGEGYAYDEENTVQAASLFNAHSFMNRPPTLRWTKQDTEMFYEGIRNFGTDLSLIQQLFPGRTRRQMYLKLKKEQRQHPLRLAEAENNRPKDHSYFMMLIKQQQAAKKQNKSDLGDISGEDDDELDTETTEQVAKSELEGDAAEGSRPLDPAEVVDANVEEEVEEEEEDDDIWGNYGNDS